MFGDIYQGRRVLVTGHTGFKGAWLSIWLSHLGAHVVGYALSPPTTPSLFEAARIGERLRHVEGDIRDIDALRDTWRRVRPEIVFHLAGQSVVRDAYRRPVETLTTNVMGTAHILEVARQVGERVALVIVTSDKCYENNEWAYGYREIDRLGGHDVYSASKAAAELLVSSYRRSFFPVEELASHGIALASVRAGNAIGGGDWTADRLVPDCIRALFCGKPIQIRNPRSVRPWQHVLEPLSGYLMLGARLLTPPPAAQARFCTPWNFGPVMDNARPVGSVVEAILTGWGSGTSEVTAGAGNATVESVMLRLSIDKALLVLDWHPRWNFDTAIARTVEWYRAFYDGADVFDCCLAHITSYEAVR